LKQDGYFICYTAGTSGAFIASLVSQIVNNTERKFAFTMNGNSHANMVDSNGGIDWALAPSPCTSEYFYRNVFTFNSAKPMVVQTHLQPAWEIAKARWPDFKAVIIQHDLADVDEIAVNLYYKYYVDDFDVTAKQSFFDVIYKQSTAFPADITHPAQLTEEEVKAFIKILIYHKISDGYMNPVVPDEYKENALILPYREIITSKDIVLNKISNFLGMPVPELSSDNYDAYLEYQQRLMSEKTGWLRPFVS
jgi:hypothetical protein